MLRRIKCLFGKHDLETVDEYGNLRVDKCKVCDVHINIHLGMEQYFTSNERDSLLNGIKQSRELFEGLKQD